MNYERINELKVFVEDFYKKLDDSHKRYEEVFLNLLNMFIIYRM